MIRVVFRDKIFEVDEKRVKLEKLLLNLHINPEDVVVLKDGRPITEDKWLVDGDEIKIHEVVSQG